MAEEKRARERQPDERSGEHGKPINRQQDDGMDDLSSDEFVTDAEIEVREADSTPRVRKGNKTER